MCRNQFRRVLMLGTLLSAALLNGTPAAAAGLRVLPLSGGRILGVSGDGSTVVGSYGGLPQNGSAFRWTAADGIQIISGSGYATGASADGRVVVGAMRGQATSNEWSAFRWTAGGGAAALGGRSAEAVSADGSVVVGAAGGAFRWTAAGGLSVLPGATDIYPNFAWGISPDGSVVAGQVLGRPARWLADGAFEYLNDPAEPLYDGRAVAASRDGSVIAGYHSEVTAFVWTAASGMQTLRPPDPDDPRAVATAISADGTVVVGSMGGVDRWDAFVWDREHGMRSLGGVLAGLGVDTANAQLVWPTGISADGTTIVGDNWIAVVPEPTAVLLYAFAVTCVMQRVRAPARRHSPMHARTGDGRKPRNLDGWRPREHGRRMITTSPVGCTSAHVGHPDVR